MDLPSLELCIHKNHCWIHTLGLQVQISTYMCMVRWNTSRKNEGRKQPKSRLKTLVDSDGEVQLQARDFRNYIEIFRQS